jgi:hypothetical protein
MAGVMPVVVILLPMYWIGWGPLVALGHTATCIAIGALVVAASTIGRCTLPCAWPVSGPGPAALAMLLLYPGAYYVFTDWFPAREARILDASAMFSMALALLLAAVVASQFGIGKAARVSADRAEQSGI